MPTTRPRAGFFIARTPMATNNEKHIQSLIDDARKLLAAAVREDAADPVMVLAVRVVVLERKVREQDRRIDAQLYEQAVKVKKAIDGLEQLVDLRVKTHEQKLDEIIAMTTRRVRKVNSMYELANILEEVPDEKLAAVCEAVKAELHK